MTTLATGWRDYDVAGIITAVATLALVLGAIAGFLLRNERRTATLEKGHQDLKDEQLRIRNSITAVHERLDGFFLGKGRRAGGPHDRDDK